jgi:hypothetical protein
MSIFGNLDAALVKTDPFFIPAGDYYATITAAEVKIYEEKPQFVITYKINDPSSQYNSFSARKIYTLPDPNMTQEDYELLSGKDRQRLDTAMSSLKRDLCGRDEDDEDNGLGVDPDDLNNPEWNPASLVGLEVVISINNYGANNTGVGVRRVVLA